MIDSHVHTHYSKHATGTIDELAEAAIQRQVTVLTITDHAPFGVDTANRLLQAELAAYFGEVRRARERYAGRVKILVGLEVDYMRGSEGFLQHLLDGLDLDFIIGSIHYVPVGSNVVRVWDLPKLDDREVLQAYFDALRGLLTCGLFDAVGHADTLLRGVPAAQLSEQLEALVPYFVATRMSYELNASGSRKSVYDPITRREHAAGRPTYPSRPAVSALLSAGATFTIGSDAHAPADVGRGIAPLLSELKPLGLRTISYYEQRRRIDVPLDELLSGNVSGATASGGVS